MLRKWVIDAEQSATQTESRPVEAEPGREPSTFGFVALQAPPPEPTPATSARHSCGGASRGMTISITWPVSAPWMRALCDDSHLTRCGRQSSPSICEQAPIACSLAWCRCSALRRSRLSLCQREGQSHRAVRARRLRRLVRIAPVERRLRVAEPSRWTACPSWSHAISSTPWSSACPGSDWKS
jgi:hypothetical protein